MTDLQIGDGMKITISDTQESLQAEKEKYSFQTTVDPDGGKHLGILLTAEELENRLRDLREFYGRGMIPFICPTCGKLWGANYDVGSLRWFRCNICGAEWELQNDDEVNSKIENMKPERQRFKVLKNE